MSRSPPAPSREPPAPRHAHPDRSDPSRQIAMSRMRREAVGAGAAWKCFTSRPWFALSVPRPLRPSPPPRRPRSRCATASISRASWMGLATPGCGSPSTITLQNIASSAPDIMIGQVAAITKETCGVGLRRRDASETTRPLMVMERFKVTGGACFPAASISGSAARAPGTDQVTSLRGCGGGRTPATRQDDFLEPLPGNDPVREQRLSGKNHPFREGFAAQPIRT